MYRSPAIHVGGRCLAERGAEAEQDWRSGVRLEGPMNVPWLLRSGLPGGILPWHRPMRRKSQPTSFELLM